jgi:OOP family OmpA-OmpF porin
MRLEVAGFASAEGTSPDNQALGLQRAQEVVRQLVALGVDPSRLTARSYGETRPQTSNATEAGRQANRRVEFIVLTP